MSAEITITIDNREDYLKANVILSSPDSINIKYENLDIADVIISINDKVVCAIERKTIVDLAASIKDGRYKDQKARLLSTFDTSQIYYLIEGSFDYSVCNSVGNSVGKHVGNSMVHIAGINKKAIISSIINTMIRDNIKVIHTKNIEDTCHWLHQVITRLVESPEKYILSSSHTPSISRYSGASTTTGKKKTATKEDVYLQQLCQVPNISYKTAQAIANVFPNFIALIGALSCGDEKLKVLKEITIKDEKGKHRKISTKVVHNLIQYVGNGDVNIHDTE